MKAYSEVTKKTYENWETLVTAEAHGYSVIAVITRGSKTWPWCVGLYPTKREADNAKARTRNRMKKDDERWPTTTYMIYVRPVWKDPR